MKAKTLFYNARVHTQADGMVADSIAVYKNRIIAVGKHIEHDPDFKNYDKINLRGKTIIPGLVDAHTHFYGMALSLGQVDLDGVKTLKSCLSKIENHARKLGRNDWVVGIGYSPDRFSKVQEPDRYMLDRITGGRPAFIFSKDQHTAWVNSMALQIAGIDKFTPDPDRGEIVRFEDGTPTGILREGPGYGQVYDCIKGPSQKKAARLYQQALDLAYRKGITGVHSFDGPEAFPFYTELAYRGKVGLRINHYPLAETLPMLLKEKIYYGAGTDFFRIAGIKIFADGSLGSQTAYCFNKYLGSKNSYGIEVTPVKELKKIIKSAARLGLPCAVHAIGDKAVANVLEALQSSPRLDFNARHRIEHLQMIRRKDVTRLKKLGTVASMQPSHCPSDINLVRKYWGKRGANAYIFRTLLDYDIPLAFGSDTPIEILDPIGGIAAAVRRAQPGKRDVFYSEQRITVAEALYAFTVGPAYAAGQEHCRGYLLPGYPADFVILNKDITKIAASRIYDIKVLATILDGKLKYCHSSLNIS